MPSLDNYISYGKDVLLENQNIQAMMMDIIDTVCITVMRPHKRKYNINNRVHMHNMQIMKHDRLEESDRVAGCKLMESVLLKCRGQVDQVRFNTNRVAIRLVKVL